MSPSTLNFKTVSFVLLHQFSHRRDRYCVEDCIALPRMYVIHLMSLHFDDEISASPDYVCSLEC